MQKILIPFITATLLTHVISPAFAGGVGVVTGFPIPRFVSTKSNESNVRTGPDTKYPVRVILKQKVPLKIVDEYQDWRQIQDWEGMQGWVHKSLLTGKHRAIIISPSENIYTDMDNNSRILAQAKKHYVLAIEECSNSWCKVDLKSMRTKGYIHTSGIWGVPK